DSTSGRTWRVISTENVNRFGRPTAYTLAGDASDPVRVHAEADRVLRPQSHSRRAAGRPLLITRPGWCARQLPAAAWTRQYPRRRERPVSTTVHVDVDDETQRALSGLAIGDAEVLEEALELREVNREDSGLDERSFALVKIAALVALDSPPAS